MSTSDQPTPPLTRRQLRELKLTGQNPVITPEEAAQAAHDAAEREAAEREAAEAVGREAVEAAERETAEREAADAAAREAEQREAAEVAEREAAALAEREAAAQDAPAFAFGGRPLTRREVREQERLRTGHVPVIDPDLVAEPAEIAEPAEVAEPAPAEPAPGAEQDAPVVYEIVDETRPGETTGEPVEYIAEPVAEDSSEASDDAARADEEFADGPVETVFVVEDAPLPEADVAPVDEDARPTVAPAFGATVLNETEPAAEPASFEEILSQTADSSGTATAASALILRADPGVMPLSAPIDATGEILITSTHALPEGFGSRGHLQGTTDGKEVDVVLIDGELPLTSSPTPIAASDAVSTSKSPAEVIRPPAPEKNHRLTLLLGITAGVLGVALIGVVVAAFTTGVLG